MKKKKYTDGNLVIEMVDEKVAIISFSLPYTEDFSSSKLKVKIRGILGPFLRENENTSDKYILDIVGYEKDYPNYKSNHLPIRVEIYIKFIHNFNFKEQILILENFAKKISAIN